MREDVAQSVAPPLCRVSIMRVGTRTVDRGGQPYTTHYALYLCHLAPKLGRASCLPANVIVR